MKSFLYSPEGKAYLSEQYVGKARSTHDIATELNTYPGLVRKALLHHGFTLRSRSEAQKASLKSGRHGHPTRGKGRTEEAKSKISRAMAKSWANMSEQERLKYSDGARQRWERTSTDERKRIATRANEGLRRAAKEGSSLERHLLLGLRAEGYAAMPHREFLFGSDEMHADIFIPPTSPLNRGVVIEVDGPTHYLPMWGEEKLAERVAADRKKTGLALANGFRMIRVRQIARHLSRFLKGNALINVLANIVGPVEEIILEI